jgi:hypothetical protein
MEILRGPHFNQFLLVYLSPFSHELSAPFWKSTLYDIKIVKLHDSKIFTILDMDVSWWMLTIDQEHPDHNSVEASNFWHGCAAYWMCQRPNAANQPREVRASAGFGLLAVASYKLPDAYLCRILATKIR